MKKLFVAVIVASSLSVTAFADSAADVWKAKCKSCHGDDGKADTKVGKAQKIDDMSTADWQTKHSDADIKKAINEGIPDTKIKPFKDKLSEAEIDSLVKHVRTLKK